MNTEQERAAFEAWFAKIKAYAGNPKDIFMQIARDIAWEAWQARAALSQDREDAARYRRLRKGDIDDVAVVRGLGAMDYGASAVIATYSDEICGDDLDSVIDHARRIEGQS